LATAGILIAWQAGTLHPLFGAARPSLHGFAYTVWAIFQQFILQSFFFLRLEKLISTRAAAVISAALFCLVHIPNLVLVIVCLFAGWLACEIFRRHRNIYALGIAHAILGITIAITIPDNLHRNMRVGIGYYHYRAQAVLTSKG
jgi:membrane protease YdiL (CAAX protease family)